MNLSDTLNKKPWTIAVAIIVLLSLWMMSGYADDSTDKTEEKLENKSLTKVTVERREATQISDIIELHGRTAADRRSRLIAETSGRVDKILAKRGQNVKKDQVLITLTKKDKELRLQKAKATLKQRELEYQAAKRLGKAGLTAQTKLAENQANLELARSEIKSAELDLDYTEIRAPFDGIFNDRNVEIGDLVSTGTSLGEVLDINPIIVRGDIPELSVANVAIDQVGEAHLITNQIFTGKVRFISNSSNDDTHTFKVELALDDHKNNIPVGVSATIQLHTQMILAHKVSPAILSLSKTGGLGVKVIDDSNKVIFKPVEIVRSEKDGVWLSGLSQTENIITVGQGFVSDQDTVTPYYKSKSNDQQEQVSTSDLNSDTEASNNE